MIYECARLKRDGGPADGVSLRDVIKGFYNYGVCRDGLWPYVAGGDPGQLSIERARDAKSLSLGAYYRLRPNLNTCHAALHETGALLVSAELHDGWRHDRVRAAGGVIVAPRPGQARGTLGDECHAFVVVGYTPEGFLVLNSWGRDWGGWAPARRGAGPGRRPLALRRLGRHHHGRLGAPPRRRRGGGVRILDRRPGPRLRRRAAGALDPGAHHPRQLPPPRRRRLRAPRAPSSPPAARSRRPSACSSRTPPAPKPYHGRAPHLRRRAAPASATRPTTSPAGSARCAMPAGIPSASSGASTTSSRCARSSKASSPTPASAPARPGPASTG